ncbi:fukutin-like [Ischnura elegans]|uniref:fukutin-like n=1 Tax=Ischnura elegans TaxID=197161 RepID=UPI001ED8698B|nr:fukutin-like [Ischnura elegans]
MKKKSAYHLVISLGAVLLTLQALLLVSLLTRERRDVNEGDEDLGEFLNVTNLIGLPVVILDHHILNRIEGASSVASIKSRQKCLTCLTSKPILLAVEYKRVNPLKENAFINKLAEYDFSVVVLYNKSPLEVVPSLDQVPIAYVCKRRIPIVVSLLHEREGNFWWTGQVYSDPEAELKLQTLGLASKDLNSLEREGALDKFEVTTHQLSDFSSPFTTPLNVYSFFREFRQSHFKECSWHRALEFEKKYGSTRKTPDGRWFAHRAWKILDRAKTILDGLDVPFWISSGTCLGYFRQCDIIPHAKDVDIGIFAKDFKKQIVPAFVARGMALKHHFGRLNDSLELSFLDLSSGVKLDLFFFYEGKAGENHRIKTDTSSAYRNKIIWNGGTQAKTGKKFKYIFPPISLCWTEFLALKVRIPCNTLDYILANYGHDWKVPVSVWDWKSSPPNVIPNGEWPQSEWPEVIRVYYPELQIAKFQYKK